jgi:hypothetical protein
VKRSGYRWPAALAGALAVTGAAVLAVPGIAQGTARAGTPWTKISRDTRLGLASAGVLRTADGRLHVAWASQDGSNTFSLHYSTVAGRARLVNTGVMVSKWTAISTYPRLVPGPGGGIRLIFTGGNGQSGSPYDLGAMYSATASAAGTAWSLTKGSLSHSTLVPLTDTAAATEKDGTPVAAWAAGPAVDYHAGVSPTTPSSAPDSAVSLQAGSVAVGPTLVRAGDGAVSVAWFSSSSHSDQGYWIDQILPSRKAPAKAPGSGAPNLGDNEPRGSVALAARAGGGSYLAYCVATKTQRCDHIALWKAGSARASTVPGSSGKNAFYAAIAAGPGGHLWILWFDPTAGKIDVVRTNSAATRFGAVRVLNGPPKLEVLSSITAEGSQGPLDVLALAQQTTAGSTPAYYDTQLLPTLRIAASATKVPHSRATTITFKVTDTGDPVPGATIKFLGKTVHTNSHGAASVKVPKGTARGKHDAVTSKNGYVPASLTITVT